MEEKVTLMLAAVVKYFYFVSGEDKNFFHKLMKGHSHINLIKSS